MQEPAGAAVLVAAGEGRRALEEPAEVFVGGTQSASGLMRTAAPISASDTGTGGRWALRAAAAATQRASGPSCSSQVAGSWSSAGMAETANASPGASRCFTAAYRARTLSRRLLTRFQERDRELRRAIRVESRVRAESSQGRRARSSVSWEPPLPSLLSAPTAGPSLLVSSLRASSPPVLSTWWMAFSPIAP
jgi:hypothetical protein